MEPLRPTFCASCLGPFYAHAKLPDGTSRPACARCYSRTQKGGDFWIASKAAKKLELRAKELHADGVSIPEIARQLGAKPERIRRIVKTEPVEWPR